jgi:hypothetical protein
MAPNQDCFLLLAKMLEYCETGVPDGNSLVGLVGFDFQQVPYSKASLNRSDHTHST